MIGKGDVYILDIYGAATWARVNKRKSILIRLGSLIGARVPDTLAYLKTLGEGESGVVRERSRAQLGQIHFQNQVFKVNLESGCSQLFTWRHLSVHS